MTKFLYLIVGASGSGKDTVVNALCKRYGYKKVISWTTRSPRQDEKDKSSHIFGVKDDYCRAKMTNSVVAETHYNGNYYWATKEQVDKSDIYIIDIPGIETLKTKYKHRPVKVIYLETDISTRRRRMKTRGDSLTKIVHRIQTDKEVFKNAEAYADKIFKNENNTNLDELVKEIHQYIRECERNTSNSLAEKSKAIDKQHLHKVLRHVCDGYKRQDMIPVSGSVLYDLCAYLECSLE